MCYRELPSRKKKKSLHTDNHAANWLCVQLQSVCTVIPNPFSLLLVIQLNLTYKAFICARLSILLLRLEFCFLVSHIGFCIPHVLAGIA